jgi:DivIVA domain-containing protein
MSTSDLDLPLLPSAEQIRRREFATIRRGYDPDQVRDYLEAVAAQVETLERGLKDATLAANTSAATPVPATPAAPDGDPYERVSKRFAGLIATADREASRIVDEAKTEADRVLVDASTEADRIRVDAQAHAEEARAQGEERLGSARDEADRILSALSTRREMLVEQLHEMRTTLLGVADELQVAIETPGDAEDATAEIDGATQTSDAEGAGGSEASRSAGSGAADAEGIVDPRYEDLWVAAESEKASGDEEDVGLGDLLGSDDDAVDIPDLSTIDLDLDDDANDG